MASNQQATQDIIPPETIKSTGLLNLSGEQVKRALFVKNISAKATVKHVSDFFNFCGNVEKIVQDADPTNDGKQFAVVVFEQESAYSTALLLGQAVIVDSSIVVYPYSKILTAIMPAASTTKTLLEMGNTAPASSTTTASASQEHRTATSVIASLIAQGYVKGEQLVGEMKHQAKQVDQQANITTKAKLALQISRQKAQEIDNSLHITQRLNSLRTEAASGVKIVGDELNKGLQQLDDKLHIKEKADKAKQATIKTATDIYNKTMENETIRNTKNYLENAIANGWNTLKTSLSSFQQETKNEIAARKGSVKGSAPAAQSSQKMELPPPNKQATGEHVDAFTLIGENGEEEPEIPVPPETPEQPVPAETKPDLIEFDTPAPVPAPTKQTQEDILKFD